MIGIATQLSEYMKSREVSAGELVSADVLRDDSLFYIETGVVILEYPKNPNIKGRKMVLLRRAGGFVGLETLFSAGQEDTLSVKAVCDVTVSVISITNLWKAYADLPHLQTAIHGKLFKDLAFLYQELRMKTEEIAYAESEYLAIRGLTDLATIRGVSHSKGTLVDVTTRELAAVTGLAEDTTRKAVAKLAGNGRLAKIGPKQILLFT